jgi:tetratricopeptide (TPR) repeat protein
LAIDPNNEVALTGKGQSLDNLGNYTQAMSYIDKALAIDPNDKFALSGKGYVLNSLGNYSQAMPYLDKALAIDPNFKDALNGKGVSLEGLGSYTQAGVDNLNVVKGTGFGSIYGMVLRSLASLSLILITPAGVSVVLV